MTETTDGQGMIAARAEAADNDEGRAAIERLTPDIVEKIWGRREFGDWGLGREAGRQPIGEIIHRMAADQPAELLVKTLFTAERLSVQVHPTAEAARALGLRHGKDEAWVVLAADPGATIGLGLKAPADPATVRDAVSNGVIEDLVHWQPVVAGDVLFAPAGTIHAIGGGIIVFEIQQNTELTYRLYDYGRPRELHIEAALAVADLAAPPLQRRSRTLAPGRVALVEAPSFVLERVTLDGEAALAPADGRPVWIAVAGGRANAGGAAMGCGEVWLANRPCFLSGQADLLLAYPGAGVETAVWRAD